MPRQPTECRTIEHDVNYPGEAPMKTGALQGVKVPYMKGLAIRMASSHGGDGASRPRKR